MCDLNSRNKPSVLATPETLPGFWIFMYRVSPLTYFVNGLVSVGLGNSRIQCAAEELLHFSPPVQSTTCEEYLRDYIAAEGGYLEPSSLNSTTACIFCTGSNTNDFLRSVSSEYQDRWRNFGIVWVYIVVNTMAAIAFYWLARVPKGSRRRDGEGGEKSADDVAEKGPGCASDKPWVSS